MIGCQKDPSTAVLITVQRGTEAIQQARIPQVRHRTSSAPPKQFDMVVGTDAKGQALFTGLATLPYTAWAQGYSLTFKKHVMGKVTFTVNAAAGTEYQQVCMPLQ